MTGLSIVAVALLMFVSVAASRHGNGDYPGRRRPMEHLSCTRNPFETMLEPEHICCYLNSTTVPCIVYRSVSCEPEDYDDDDYEDDNDFDDDDDDEIEDDYSDENNHNEGGDPRRSKRSMSFSWSWRTRNMCWERTVTNCTLLFCTPTCCVGWRRDAMGRCVVPEYDTSQDVVCENDGLLLSDTCVCVDGFQGRFCEIPICDGGCGAGQCKVVFGNPECVCPRDFSGRNCEEAVCIESCEHGQCVPDGAFARCLCEPGYSGTRCDTVMDKPGMCPSSIPFDMLGLCSDLCSVDNECPGIKKCCNNGCGHGCATPSNGTCITEDGRTIEVDQEFSPNPCKICTCMKAGTIECREIRCPRMIAAGCMHIVNKPGECCPVCDHGTPNMPAAYQPPRILDCPRTIKPIQVEETSNFAIVPELKAIDFRGATVAVHLSQTIFRSCACIEQDGNLHRVTAITGRDEYGNFTHCHFTIDVQDIHNPKFKTCPASISAWSDEQIFWDKPEVGDNVGIYKQDIQTPYEKGSQFEIGVHSVILTAVDYDGNRDTCSFIVSIFETNTEYSELPAELKRRHEFISKETIIAGVVCGGVALILLFVVIITCCMFRRRKMRAAARANTNQASTASYDNGLYSIYGKPPPYSSPSKTGSVKSASPHIYDEISSTPTKTALEAFYQTMEQNTPPQENGAYDNPVYSTAGEAKIQNETNSERAEKST